MPTPCSGNSQRAATGGGEQVRSWMAGLCHMGVNLSDPRRGRSYHVMAWPHMYQDKVPDGEGFGGAVHCFSVMAGCALCSPVPMGVPTASRSLVETNVPRVRRQRAYGGLHAATSAAASFHWPALASAVAADWQRAPGGKTAGITTEPQRH